MAGKKRWVKVVAVLGVLVAAYAVVVLLSLEEEASVTNSVIIDRPPEVVFDYGIDMRHELEWNPDVVTMKKVTDGPVGLGTRYAAEWKQSGAVEVTVTAADRPRSFTFTNGGDISATVAITIAPQGSGSLLTSKFTARPHGFMIVMFPIFKLMMAKFEKANMGYLKKAIETHT